MSISQPSIPVYIDRTDLIAAKITSMPPGIGVFRDKNNVQNRHQLHSVCRLMWPGPLGTQAQVRALTDALEFVGVLLDEWRADHMADRTYNVAPNFTPAVTMLLKNKNEDKINFGKTLYLTKKGVDEVGIPKECFVAHTEKLQESVFKIGVTAVDYNKRVTRAAVVSLHIEPL